MKTGAIITIFIIGILAACTDDDPNTPDADACFTLSPTAEMKAGDEVAFTNCSQNATEYIWDFGDGASSSQSNPSHAYAATGEYTVKLVAANENSVNEVEKTINVGSNSFMKIDGEPYPLTKAELHHQNQKWHSIFLYDGLIDLDSETGTGNLVCIDVLAGSGGLQIEGTYSISTQHFDGDSAQIAQMKNFTMYNGFCAFANDYNLAEWDYVNDAVADADISDYSNFNMKISKEGENYHIEISVTVKSKQLEVDYLGKLEVK